MNALKILKKLEDFRLLPFFVIISIIAGILIGKELGISEFQLTPPIDAIKQILSGTFTLTIPNALSLGVPVGLFLMIYPAMTNVRIEDIGNALKAKKQLAIVLLFNFAVAPFFMLLLANLFVGDPEFHMGVVLYGLAPCIAMVIVFTYLAKGNNALALVLVAFNSILQMILIPVYASLLIGNVNFDVFIVAESVILYLGIPLLFGVMTRKYCVKRYGEKEFENKFTPILSALSIIGLLFTLIVMFSLKGDVILETPGIILIIALPITIFFIIMFAVVYLVSWKLKLNYEDSVACAFNSTGRDFEIAIAIAITAFTPAVALATVVGPLIEVPVMLFLVWAAKNSKSKLFTEK
ncbi:MAG: arsenic resistance protein [Candidatus Altiarchaeum hamiconexum]|uniref:Arsenic resistance protein n=1 Tax=Candidatus Altarchaeum hamiconexum TaxID=1803513 RepID=A0A8J7YYF3_9ARCH|nr:arsenic resistance protein [Candidatus Altarchaeum hamiconexum]NCN68267.1 arsenic resistance protein [Candidatus Altarchaeum hamiconexum]NCS90979.1 arsenic resistance protein [Candidatus Altarchaeum hamiconexum]